MRIITVADADELSHQTLIEFETMRLEKHRPLRGFLPAGRSAQGFYQQLCANPEVWEKKIRFVQMDEFAQENVSEGFFLRQLKDQILQPLNLVADAEVIDPRWSAPEMQSHIEGVIDVHLDFALLGFGPNGHVAFHEPGSLKSDFLGGSLELSEESFRRVVLENL